MIILRNFISRVSATGCLLLVIAGCSGGKALNSPVVTKDALLEKIPENFAFAAAQYERLLARVQNDPKLPRTFENGKLVTVTPEDWTSGFFPGSLWFLYEYTKDPKWLAAATNYTERLDRIKNF